MSDEGTKRDYVILDRTDREDGSRTYTFMGMVAASGASTALRRGAEQFKLSGIGVAVTARSWFEAPVEPESVTRYNVGSQLELVE